MESKVRDMETVRLLREGRDATVRLSQAGSLSEVLTAPSNLHRDHTYVVKLLDVHPALGKVKGRRLMAELAIKAFSRLADLDTDTRDALLIASGEVS
jgi:hypothetical protein